MNHWDQLVKTALLGTEKSGIDLKTFPLAIQAYTDPLPETDQETHFYTIAALVYGYERAGQLPDNTPLPPLEPAPEETATVCPPQVAHLMDTLLLEKNRHANLLLYCFTQIAQKNWVLPYAQLTPIFNLAILPSYKNLQPIVPKIAGSRGAWLSHFNPAWKVLNPNITNQIWENGTLAERRKWLINLRLENPQLFLDLLKITIEAERNARERKEWIRLLQGLLSTEELHFVQFLFEQLPPPGNQDKPVIMETRRLLAEMLLNAPLSILCADVAVQLKRYVVAQKRILGMRSKFVLEIPTQFDDFLCPEMIVQQLGFEADSPIPGLSTTEFWFCELARCVHPEVWENVFDDRPWSEILVVFAKSNARQSGTKLPLLQHLSHALARTLYRKAIQAFVQEYVVDESNYFMLNTLHNEELEKLVMSQSQGIIPDYLKEVLQRPNWVWSKPFSRFMLQCFIAPRANGIHYQEFGKMTALHLHFDLALLPELEQFLDTPAKNNDQHQLQRNLVVPLIHLLKLRKSINELI